MSRRRKICEHKGCRTQAREYSAFCQVHNARKELTPDDRKVVVHIVSPAGYSTATGMLTMPISLPRAPWDPLP